MSKKKVTIDYFENIVRELLAKVLEDEDLFQETWKKVFREGE